MTQHGTLKVKFTATYSEVEEIDIDADELEEHIVVQLSSLGDVETSYEESDGEIEFKGILRMDGERTYHPATMYEPADEEISVSVAAWELKELLQLGTKQPFVSISEEEWEAA